MAPTLGACYTWGLLREVFNILSITVFIASLNFHVFVSLICHVFAIDMARFEPPIMLHHHKLLNIYASEQKELEAESTAKACKERK